MLFIRSAVLDSSIGNSEYLLCFPLFLFCYDFYTSVRISSMEILVLGFAFHIWLPMRSDGWAGSSQQADTLAFGILKSKVSNFGFVQIIDVAFDFQINSLTSLFVKFIYGDPRTTALFSQAVFPAVTWASLCYDLSLTMRSMNATFLCSSGELPIVLSIFHSCFPFSNIGLSGNRIFFYNFWGCFLFFDQIVWDP